MDESETIYWDGEPCTEVIDGYVEEYKERFISHLVKNYLESKGTDPWDRHIHIDQKEKNLTWREFEIHKKSDTEYIGKSKDGLSFEIIFDVDEDVELDSQIKKFIEVDPLTDFISAVNVQYSVTNEHFTSLSGEQKRIRIANLLVIGCYLGYVDEMDYELADNLFEFIDECYEDEDWKRGISIARDCGSYSGYGMQDEEPDYPLHPMFAR
jgi:hypothetical protein